MSFLSPSTHILLLFLKKKNLHSPPEHTHSFYLALEPCSWPLHASLQHGNFLLPSPNDIPHVVWAWELKQDALLGFLPYNPFPASNPGSKRLEACWSHHPCWSLAPKLGPLLLLLHSLDLWDRPDLPKAPVRKCRHDANPLSEESSVFPYKSTRKPNIVSTPYAKSFVKLYSFNLYFTRISIWTPFCLLHNFNWRFCPGHSYQRQYRRCSRIRFYS